MDIPLFNVAGQYQEIKSEIKRSIDDVLDSGQYIMGKNVQKFEEAVANYLGVKYAIGVASGTDALILSLDALGIGPGDEVITTPFTFFATAECISRLGAKPVFADIDPTTLTVDIDSIENAITPRTKAIIPVHIYGRCADMPKVMELARKHNLFVVEDVCQAMGGDVNGKKLGTWGDAGAFSFFPTKNLGAFGDGGLIATNDDALAEHIRMLRTHGSKEKYHNEIVGYNSRLDEIQAAVLLVKLAYLDKWNDDRRRIAEEYIGFLKELPIQLPQPGVGREHVFHLFTVLTDDRDRLMEFLKSRGIQTGVYYPIPLHLLPVYEELGYKKGSLPISEISCERALSLPMYPGLTEEQISYVAGSIADFFDTRYHNLNGMKA